MELKLITHKSNCTIRIVLIVPYGIETASSSRYCFFVTVLIVPYGIET